MDPTTEGLTSLFAVLVAIVGVVVEVASLMKRTRSHDETERRAENAWREIRPE